MTFDNITNDRNDVIITVFLIFFELVCIFLLKLGKKSGTIYFVIF